MDDPRPVVELSHRDTGPISMPRALPPMRKTIPPDPAELNRRPSVVEAEPGATVITIEIDGTRHRLAPDEARAIARALLAGALVVSGRLDDENLDFDDEPPWAF